MVNPLRGPHGARVVITLASRELQLARILDGRERLFALLRPRGLKSAACFRENSQFELLPDAEVGEHLTQQVLSQHGARNISQGLNGVTQFEREQFGAVERLTGRVG